MQTEKETGRKDGGRQRISGCVQVVFRLRLHFKFHNVSQAGPGLKESCHVAPRLSPRDPRIWIWRPHVLQIDQRSHWCHQNVWCCAAWGRVLQLLLPSGPPLYITLLLSYYWFAEWSECIFLNTWDLFCRFGSPDNHVPQTCWGTGLRVPNHLGWLRREAVVVSKLSRRGSSLDVPWVSENLEICAIGIPCAMYHEHGSDALCCCEMICRGYPFPWIS